MADLTLSDAVSAGALATGLASTLDEAIRAANGAFAAVEAGGAMVAQLRGHHLDHESVVALFEHAARLHTDLQMRLAELRRAAARPLASEQSIEPSPGALTLVELCIPDDQRQHAEDIPQWALRLPAGAPVPRQGEVIYLSSTSAWGVELVVHERISRDLTRIEVWIKHVGSARCRREGGTRLQ